MISSELLRIRYSLTTRVVLAILVAEALFVGLLVAFLPSLIDGLIALNKVIPNATSADRLSEEQLAALTLASPQIQTLIADILGNTGVGTSLPVIAATLFGALAITGEFRRGSIINAVLNQPIRPRLILAKATAIIATSVAAAILLIVVQGGILGLGLIVQNVPLLINVTALLSMWGRGIAALILYALLGMGIGLLVRNQVATISAVFAAIVIESIVRPLALLIFGAGNPTLYLPFGLGPDLIASTPLSALGADVQLSAGISAPAAMVTLALWACAMLAVATARFARTDIPVHG